MSDNSVERASPQIGVYLLKAKIGQGRMATVFKAWDTRENRWVAIKVLRVERFAREEAAVVRRRFSREIKTLQRLRHPAIVPVWDYGEYHHRPYLVMPYYPQGTLKSYLRGQPVSWQRAVSFLLPLLDGLAYAHAHGVVHRDIKPSNILIGSDRCPVLGDFGIVMRTGGVTESLTTTRASIGTPEYMAPEQALGREVDQRADLYAVGCILYEMLTGVPPYRADTPVAVIMQHIQAEVPSLMQQVPGVLKALEKVLRKTLAKQPAKRYARAEELRADLEALLQKSEAKKKHWLEQKTFNFSFR